MTPRAPGAADRAEVVATPDPLQSARERLGCIDWQAVGGALDARGWATVANLLDARSCAALVALYAQEAPFRKRLVMERYGFGRGTYGYFAYPLPDLVHELRTQLYPPLARVADRWSEALGAEVRYPATLDGFLARCGAAGQSRPTPLLLAYKEGDFNALHQDLYGELAFPLQVTVLLSAQGRDFTGGEFVMTEQRPRKQARVHVVPLELGDAVIFAGRHRPAQGSRGFHRLNVRHGVCEIRSGRRYTLGIIFHDAR